MCEVTKHPLFQEVRRHKIPLWKLRRMLGGSPSECTISRMLNGIDPMPADIESGIKRIIDEAKRESEQPAASTAAK